MDDLRREILEVLYDLAADEPSAFFDPRLLGTDEASRRNYCETADALLKEELVFAGYDGDVATNDLRISAKGTAYVEAEGWRGPGVMY